MGGIRDCGTVGGNLMLAKTKGFLSDLATILLGHSGEVTIQIGTGTQRMSLEEFLDSPTFGSWCFAWGLFFFLHPNLDNDSIHTKQL